MPCGKHCQKGFNLILFSYEVLSASHVATNPHGKIKANFHQQPEVNYLPRVGPQLISLEE